MATAPAGTRSEVGHQHTKDWSAKVDSADAFVFVMPEYNYGFNAPLKNAIDYLNHEWRATQPSQHRHRPAGGR
jgi:NAD(P)H-dependent FMN reductase